MKQTASKIAIIPTLFAILLAFDVIAAQVQIKNKEHASYHLVWHKANNRLELEICVKDDLRHRFVNSRVIRSKKARPTNLKNARFKQRYIEIENIQGSPCFSFLTNLNELSNRQLRIVNNDTLLLDTNVWLWHSKSIENITLRVTDEQNRPLDFHVPFKKEDNIYRLSTSTLEWTSRSAIGEVKHKQLALGNRNVNVILLSDLGHKEAKLTAFLYDKSKAMMTAFGRFPIDSANILIIPSGKGRSPIPWGEVQRAGHPSVHLFINENRPITDFYADWTTSHELSHLFVPKIAYQDRWLSEGIASYYQNVLRSRAGLLTQQQAFEKLVQGFSRGRKSAGTTTLRNARKIMHLYWGGVAFYYLADLRLRESGSSLESVLEKFNRCCLPSDITWRARDFTQKLDELSQSRIFTNLLQNEAQQRHFILPKELQESTHPLVQKHINAILLPPEK